MLVVCDFGTLLDADISGIAIKVKKIKIKIYDLKRMLLEEVEDA